MRLNDPQRMEELFALLHKVPSKVYQDNELNKAINNALLLEGEERAITESGRRCIVWPVLLVHKVSVPL